MALSRASDVSRADYGVEIAVYGLANVQKVLRQLSGTDAEFGEVSKVLDTEIRQALNKTRDNARKRIPTSPPMSGWYADKSDAGYRNWWRVQAGSTRRARRKDGSVGGWPVWDASKARTSLKVGKGQSSDRHAKGLSSISVAWRLEQTDAAGTIYDKAGQRSDGKTPQGVAFVRVLRERRGNAQRVLWPAWMETRAEAIASINASIRKMEERMNALIARMDNAA